MEASLASCSLGRPMPRPLGAWRGFGCHAIRLLALSRVWRHRKWGQPIVAPILNQVIEILMQIF